MLGTSPRMHPLFSMLDAIAEAFNRDCQIISDALNNSLSESFTLSSKASENFWKIYWDAFTPVGPMEEVNKKEGDDLFNAVCGDLGLGETQRSSFFLNYDLEVNKYFSTPAYKQGDNLSHSDSDLSSLHHDGKYRFQDLFKKGFLNSVFSLTHHGQKHGVEYETTKSDSESEVFPMYADVLYGTSYRQQKKLYEKEMDHLRQQKSVSEFLENSPSRTVNIHSIDAAHLNLTPAELDTKLFRAIEEMDELKVELDACCKRLDAKYQAVAILKKQAEFANSELQSSQDKFHEQNKSLEKEVSKLRFELEWRESSFMDSQQTWADRFDQVCKENNLLMSKLEARSDELRRMTAHKSALDRERDELLALLDVTERLKYEQGKSLIAEDEYGSFSSSELAVLGACKCRGADPEPCGCAHAAANLRKEVAKLREENEQIQQRRQEAHLTVDAYRTAFEEQLTKTKTLSKRLAEVTTLTSRSVKAKAAMKYLVQVLADDEIENDHFMKKEKETEFKPMQDVTPMNLHELLHILTDMVIDKKEILAHQKLASKVLANKLSIYESNSRHSNKQPSLLKQQSDPTGKHLAQEENFEQDQGEKTPVDELSETESSISIGRQRPEINPHDNTNQTNTQEVNQTTEDLDGKAYEVKSSTVNDRCSSPQRAHSQTLPSINEQMEEDWHGVRCCLHHDLSSEDVDTTLEESMTSEYADQGHDESIVNSAKSETESTIDSAKIENECIIDSPMSENEFIITSAMSENESIITSAMSENESIITSAMSENESFVNSTISEAKSTNPFESSNEDEHDIGDSQANADNGSSEVKVEKPVPKLRSLNPFESDEEEEEEETRTDGDQGQSNVNHYISNVNTSS